MSYAAVNSSDFKQRLKLLKVFADLVDVPRQFQMRCRVVERPRGEDGGHKWLVKQWSVSRAKCSDNLMVSKLFVKIHWGPTVRRLESKGRQLVRDPLFDR